MLDLSQLNVVEWIVLVAYTALLLFIFFYSLTQVTLIVNYRKRKQLKTPDISTDWPHVTIQLPVFNEKYVAERLIHSIVKLDYPKDKLEIQVLDDSTDDTIDLTRKAAAIYADKGFDIKVIHRIDRSGYKAGALAEGLAVSKGEFVAIFDADFIPKPSFLKQTIPHFQDSQVGVVQTRWEHLNRNYSELTKLQAFGLDAHFTVEQGGRNQAGYFINFNGTAGVWRKKCIEDAGGWSSDTLTEDLDLSYRAQLKNWKFIFREDIGSPAELPAAMNALKNQQFRWTKGAAECTRKNLGKVWKANHLSLGTKVHALFHLMNSFIFICVIGTAILSVPMLFIKEKLGQDNLLVIAGSIFLLSMIFLMWFYYTSYRVMQPHKNIFQFIATFFLFLSMSMGLSLHNALAVFEGFIGKKSPFVRTPKFNIVQKHDGWKSNTYLTSTLNSLTLLELALTAYFSFAVLQGIKLEDFGLLPFHLLLAIGFGLVSILSAKHSLIKAKA